MDPTIRVKNEHDDDVEVSSITAGDPITIEAGKEEDLTRPYLQSTSFHELLAGGKLRLILTQAPSDAQYELARQVLPMLLRTLSGSFLSLHSSQIRATTDLEKRKDQYNKGWVAVEEVIKKAESSADGSDFLAKGVKHYLNAKPEQAHVEKIEGEIALLESEDLDASGRTLAEWYADRKAKEQVLEQAEARVAAAKARYETPWESLMDKLESAVAAFKSADHTKDIGSQIASW